MENESVKKGEEQPVSDTNPYFADYMKTLVLRKLQAGKGRTADNYLSAANKFCVFLNDKADTLTLLNITPHLIGSYLDWLVRTEELAEGTIDFYLRTVKAMYNQGIKEFRLQQQAGNPFAGTAIKVPATRKRALPDELFTRLMCLDLSDKPRQLTALHLALFLFYARGMSFIDAFNLTDANIVDNYIVYNRSKTHASLQVKITPEMKQLLKMYRKKHCPWIFPFLHEKVKGYGEVTPQSSLRRMNTYLKEIGGMLELPHPLTTYVMRHSWASMMLEAGSELGVISQSLGHTSMHTTEIYLSNLSVGKIDKAADDMLNTFVRKKKYYRKELLSELEEEEPAAAGSVPEIKAPRTAAKAEKHPASHSCGRRPKKKEHPVSKVWAAITAIASKMRGVKK